MPSHDRRTRTLGLLASIHPRHPIWGKIIWLFDRLWRIIWWLWTSVILGGILVGAAAALITSSNGTTGLADPRTWIVIRPLLAHPRRATAGLALALILTLLAYLAHRAWSRYAAEDKNAASEYGLQRVDRLDADAYVPIYVERVYLPRHEADGGDADARASAALRAAATRADPAAPDGPLGICVFGRPTEGKTRLAWEALRAALPDWTFVKWPYSRARDFDYAAYRGQNVALWLDDLQKYSADEATTLNDLPRRFATAGARLVVVATCRDDKDETLVRGRHESLLARLTPIRPVDISDAEASQLAAALAKEGVEVRIDQFDRTPGSLLLGVRRMRDERYPALSPDAKHTLWALKLLRSAGIYEYPGPRVRVVAGIFGLNEAYWRDTLNELAGAGFVRIGAIGAGGDRALEPVADAYLDDAVPEYPSPLAANATAADDWPALQRILTQQRDAAALWSLGDAYSERPLGNLRDNQQHAIACYTAALDDYTRDTAPAEWAGVQNSMGIALAALARVSEGPERKPLFEEAVAAYRAALTVFTRAAAPADWATTQNNLAVTLGAQAGLAEGAERARLLEAAAAASRAALTVFTRAAAPADWAMTQNNLAITLSD
ncbi:MAG TPA: hypothetical protein VLJ14_04695, partial [Ktedonobacterales bacterium]|nr:hypothetical protein [Ktedonobacterales bacterium]